MTLLDESSKAGRWFLIITQFFIFVSVVVFSLSTLPDLTIKQINTLNAIELVVLFVFVAEYLFRLALTKHRLKFALSFYGVVDFISIMPALLGANTQAFRVFRVLRIFKIFRYPNPKIEPPTIKNHTKHLKKSPHSIFATHKTQTFF